MRRRWVFASAAVVSTALLSLGTADVGPPAHAGAHRCTGAEVWTLVRTFADSFNAGQFAVLDRLFARGADFRWYSTTAPGERFNRDALDRATLIPYLMNRHVHHERLELTWFKVTTSRDKRSRATWVDFQYRLVRSADDLPATPYHGKGAAFCPFRPHTIAVWSMGEA